MIVQHSTLVGVSGFGEVGLPIVAVSTLELSIRMLVALALVLAMLAGINAVIRGRFGGSRSSQAPIGVRYQQRLDKQASVHLIEAGGRHFLVGTSAQSIVLLAEGEDLDPDRETQPRSSAKSAERPFARTQPPALKSSAPKTQSEDRAIDIRSGSLNPIRALQDKTTRRS